MEAKKNLTIKYNGPCEAPFTNIFIRLLISFYISGGALPNSKYDWDTAYSLNKDEIPVTLLPKKRSPDFS